MTSPVLSCSSYVRFDILQRILSRMFGVTVIHAMVITDIDDKIIRRGWEVRLMISDRLIKAEALVFKVVCLCRRMCLRP